METLKYRLQQEITLKNELQASYVKLNNQLSEVRVSYSQEVKLREQLENKVKFIHGVVSGEIIVNNRKKSDLVQELRQKGFTPFPKKAKPVEAAVAGATDSAEEESEETLAVPGSRSTFISDETRSDMNSK